MSVVWTKESVNGEVVEVANLGTLTNIEVDLEFQQEKSKGLFGKARDKFKPADPDLTAVAFAGSMPVDYVEPKDHRSILDNTVQHHGDARGAGVETVTFALGNIRDHNRDITGFGLTVSCIDGFSRVAGAVVRIYDRSSGERIHLDNIRFDLLGNHTGALLGLLRKTDQGWQFMKAPVYGQATDWRQLAGLARNHL